MSEDLSSEELEIQDTLFLTSLLLVFGGLLIAGYIFDKPTPDWKKEYYRRQAYYDKIYDF